VPEAILNSPKRGRQGLGWERSFQADFPAIMREIDLIAESPIARRCLDVPRLQRLADRWAAAPPAPGTHNNEFRAVLATGVSVGAFLRRFEAGGNGTAA
jgi:asparagine synthase (glutamine-hydrolysing)